MISQQLAVKAAATIFQRLVDASDSVRVESVRAQSLKPGSVESVSNDSITIEPGAGDFASVRSDAVAQMRREQLRGCGLSGRQSIYLVEFANDFLNGSVDTKVWRRQHDEHVIDELVKIKGIGRWIAELFLNLYMLRPNVPPIDDIGLQRAMRLHYNKGERLSRPDMLAIAENWRPWRSVATWFMWRSLDPKS